MYEDNKKKYTVKDYDALPEGSPYQLINGDLVLIPAPSPYHQKIVGNVFTLLKLYLQKNNIGEVYLSPIDVFFSEYEMYQPDIIFISKEKLKIIGDKMIEGSPDIVIEVLSESNAYYDLRIKKNTYESTGVKEYWIIDPIAKIIDVLENRNGEFYVFSKAKPGEIAKSKLLDGLLIEPANIF